MVWLHSPTAILTPLGHWPPHARSIRTFTLVHWPPHANPSRSLAAPCCVHTTHLGHWPPHAVTPLGHWPPHAVFIPQVHCAHQRVALHGVVPVERHRLTPYLGTCPLSYRAENLHLEPLMVVPMVVPWHCMPMPCELCAIVVGGRVEVCTLVTVPLTRPLRPF